MSLALNERNRDGLSEPRLGPEADLAARLNAREPRALAELYERYGPACFGFLLGVLRDRPAAEDVQQQVFLEVWQRATTYDAERGGFMTWIMTIARSRAIDHLRRRTPEPVGTLEDREEMEPDTDEIEALAERWRLAGYLRTLHPEESLVLRMRFYEDLTQTEIAERTGIPLGTVKMRMVSGLDRLRARLEER